MKKNCCSFFDEGLLWRLFLRFLAFFALCLLLSLGVLRAFEIDFLPSAFPLGTAVLLALLSAFTLLPLPLLYVLSFAEALAMAACMRHITRAAIVGHASFWRFNGCLCITAAHAMLFCFAAALALSFFHHNHKSNAKLLLSKPFLRYLAILTILSALSFLFCFLWVDLFWLSLY